ncbi:MAG: AAA family ATPase [Dermatophilaceae bacterium]|nr:AAA family ATPase [Intrasporangiaceae bacterium]
MPLLGPTDALPGRPRRVLVGGVSGCGKSTLAARIAETIGAPHVEIDALFHGPGWTARPDFVTDVERFVAGAAWTTEWQYSAVRPLLLHSCDLLVWLDLPTDVVMRQVVARTIRRRVRREVLWNDNVEPPLRSILTDREHIVRWAWSSRRRPRQRTYAALAERPNLPVVRLRSHAESARWLDEVLTPVAGS